MQRGDVIIYHSRSCNDDDAHATVVTYANGSDVRIAAHSSPQFNRSYTYLQYTMPYYEFLQYPGRDTRPRGQDMPWLDMLLSD